MELLRSEATSTSSTRDSMQPTTAIPLLNRRKRRRRTFRPGQRQLRSHRTVGRLVCASLLYSNAGLDVPDSSLRLRTSRTSAQRSLAPDRGFLWMARSLSVVWTSDRLSVAAVPTNLLSCFRHLLRNSTSQRRSHTRCLMLFRRLHQAPACRTNKGVLRNHLRHLQFRLHQCSRSLTLRDPQSTLGSRCPLAP